MQSFTVKIWAQDLAIYWLDLSQEEWNNRIPESLSSPSAQRYKKCVKGIKINLARASLREVEYKILQQQLNEQCKQKLTSRKSLQTGGELTGAWAQEQKHKKRQKEKKEAERKATKAISDVIRKAQKAHERAGVDARRAERQRKARVKELQAIGESIPEELLILIRDPTKNPTPEELEALQPHPSLSQMIDDISIDPQILAESPKISENTADIDVLVAEEEENIIDYEIHENSGSEGYTSDDSMNANFIRFKY